MPEKKKTHAPVKTAFHSRNQHRGRYDLEALVLVNPDLGQYVHTNVHGDRSVDFFNPKAVLALNKALVLHFYGMDFWDFPEGYLCPPIPGRADYLHHMADVLSDGNNGVIPTGAGIRCLDIGVGASCVYPIIGRSEYGWSFICSDIDEVALESAKNIVGKNLLLADRVHCRLQSRKGDIFHGVIHKAELMDIVICNPPFHASEAEARAGSIRKLSNLKGKKVKDPVLNFGGQAHELWTEGGEKGFIENLIRESRHFAKSSYCYSTQVSKESTLKAIHKALAKAQVEEYKVIPMGHGNKVSRIVTWTYLTVEERREWAATRWDNSRQS